MRKGSGRFLLMIRTRIESWQRRNSVTYIKQIITFNESSSVTLLSEKSRVNQKSGGSERISTHSCCWIFVSPSRLWLWFHAVVFLVYWRSIKNASWTHTHTHTHGGPHNTAAFGNVLYEAEHVQKYAFQVLSHFVVRPRSTAVHRPVSSFSDSLIKLLIDFYPFSLWPFFLLPPSHLRLVPMHTW